MIVKPFRGLRPRRDLADKIPSVPYDVVSTEEARRLARGNPDSFLHVVRAEIDLDPEVDPYDDRVYARAAENLDAMIDDGRMVRDDRPAYYVYRLEVEDHVQTGIVGAAAVADYLAGRIKKHEHTRPAKENDRIRVVESLSAHPGPVFLIHRDLPALNAWVEKATAAEPQVSFAADGVRHSLWPVADSQTCGKIERAFAEMPCTYVADGHHRAAAASKAFPDLPDRHFLAVHFPVDQVRVLDYNRVVRDLNGNRPAELLDRIAGAGFDVRVDNPARRPADRGSFGMYLDGRWCLLTARESIVPRDDLLASLDVSILTDRLLRPILGIGDPRTDARIDFVGGSRGMDGLERRIGPGKHAVAFALYPTSLDDVMRVADADRVMPPKSTWFEPKLRSGLVVQLIGDL